LCEKRAAKVSRRKQNKLDRPASGAIRIGRLPVLVIKCSAQDAKISCNHTLFFALNEKDELREILIFARPALEKPSLTDSP
jgi:hypothetical protein